MPNTPARFSWFGSTSACRAHAGFLRKLAGARHSIGPFGRIFKPHCIENKAHISYNKGESEDEKALAVASGLLGPGGDSIFLRGKKIAGF